VNKTLSKLTNRSDKPAQLHENIPETINISELRVEDGVHQAIAAMHRSGCSVVFGM